MIYDQKVIERVEQMCAAITEAHDTKYPILAGRDTWQLENRDMAKYHRIVHVTGAGTDRPQRSVLAFVDALGGLYMPAGWKGPVKPARFNLADDGDWAMVCHAIGEGSGIYGGFLYADAAKALRRHFARLAEDTPVEPQQL